MTESYDVGVVVGRFQVHELHEAHRELIERVCRKHDKVIVVLGVSPLWATRENPLDFEARKQMVLADFPRVNVLFIKDRNGDALWSSDLDHLIGTLATPKQSVVLYGGRDSFIERYSGRYPTEELEQDTWIAVSGKRVRDEISRRSVKATPDFRAGVVWAAHSRFPTCYPTVDMAVLDERHERILLGRKPGESKFRLFGGFAEPDSHSYEEDARREVFEEAGIDITDPVYVGSFKIDDWRYRGEVDKIKTLLFVCNFRSGNPRPGDDIEEVRWFPLDNPIVVNDAHVPLINAVYDWIRDQTH